MEQLSKVEGEGVPARDLGNSGTLAKEVEEDNQRKENCATEPETHSVVEFKSQFSVIDVTNLESGNEENLMDLNSINEPDSDPLKTTANDNTNLQENLMKEFWLTLPQRRGIFPKINEGSNKIIQHPRFRSSFVEHNYFQNGKFGLLPRKIKIRKSALLKAQSKNTYKFENGSESGKNKTEKQTIDVRNSITTNHVDSNSNLSESSSVKEKLNGKSVNKNLSNIRCAAAVTHIQGANKSVRFLTPKIRIRRSSKGSGDCYDVIVQEDASMPPPYLASKSDSSEVKKLSKNLGIQSSNAKGERKLESRKRGHCSDDIAHEVLEMEKIAEPRSGALLSAENVGLKNGEVLGAKVRKLSGKDVSESQNEGGFVLPKPNSTKAVPGDKNWNLEYTEDDVKNLGLDDLLLRASELNAENFTKALGQNSAGRNGNKVDSPDIVLSFPASKRESDDPLGGDNSKGGNVKKAKLEIVQKCVPDDRFTKSIEKESLKKVADAPKKPGIKVKTVENINEEFKDSLGAKMKNLEGRVVAPETSIPVFTINDNIPESNQAKGIFVRDKVPEKQPALSCRKVNKQHDPTKKIDEISGETRPYIMAIVQNKDNTAKDRMPAGLTPKIFVKPKPVTILPSIEGRPGDAAINKIPEGRDSRSKADDNFTFAVPEPRSYQVVNVNAYQDPKVKKTGINSHFVLNCGSLTKKASDGKNLIHATLGSGARKKNIPIVLSRNRKYLRMPLVNNQKLLISPADSKQINSCARPQNRVVNSAPVGTANMRRENNSKEIPSFTISRVEQGVTMKDARPGMGGVVKYVQMIPNIVSTKAAQVKKNSPQIVAKTNSELQNFNVSQPRQQMMSLPAFATILKDILPDKWILSLDKKFGLQILKTHLDGFLNPSIMISVVIGKSGKVTVNVRGRQLESSHELFDDLCDVGNSKERISINYILAIMNRLRFYGICYGCDDLSLKKYWCEDGFIEYYTEFQQTYRSHICESLIRLGRKRCHPCYRMHESLKKRRRREIIAKKAGKLPKPKPVDNFANPKYSMTHNSQDRVPVKQNLEEYIEEAFVYMRRRMLDEIETAKEEEENEKIPKTQDEVLGFMGLTRKESLDVNVRKSKRERKGSKKYEPMLATRDNREELYFLDKYWSDIYVLFNTSLLVGAYSRLTLGKLKEKCKKFHRLLATWRQIIRDNAVYVGGYFNLAENLVNEEEMVDSESVKKKFDKMDIAALRAYVINCVKELNRMKNRLRTKNRYFRMLCNTFLKPNMQKARQTMGLAGSSDGNANSVAGKSGAKKKKTPQKLKKSKVSTSVEIGSSE